jgi:hypothetical protein
MASSLMKGTVTLTDSSKVSFVIGPRERIKAERELGVKANDLKEGNVGEVYLAYLIFEAVRRGGRLEGVTFDQFVDEHLADYEVEADPESVTPLEQ